MLRSVLTCAEDKCWPCLMSPLCTTALLYLAAVCIKNVEGFSERPG